MSPHQMRRIWLFGDSFGEKSLKFYDLETTLSPNHRELGVHVWTGHQKVDESHAPTNPWKDGVPQDRPGYITAKGLPW